MSAQIKILMVMPSLPFPATGAEQQDRAHGIRQLLRLGYAVRVITKLNEWQDATAVATASAALGAEIIGVYNKYSNRTFSTREKVARFADRILHPSSLDGAAYEYAEPEIQAVFLREVKNWKPDIAWFEYTFLWPLYHSAQAADIPIVARSSNFEPEHFLAEDGDGILNRIKYLAKLRGEKKTLHECAVTLSITPREQVIYERLGARKVINVPLRSLPTYSSRVIEIRDRRPLKVFFMGSTYTVKHNVAALKQVITEIAPRVYAEDPLGFEFHILGNKIPANLSSSLGRNVCAAGYVKDLTAYLSDMDIALIPSLFGSGMQQKIFEPLVSGFPVLTSARGIAGYPFQDGEHLFCAASTQEFVEKLKALKDIDLRRRLAHNAKVLSQKLFSTAEIDRPVVESISYALSHKNSHE